MSGNFLGARFGRCKRLVSHNLEPSRKNVRRKPRAKKEYFPRSPFLRHSASATTDQGDHTSGSENLDGLTPADLLAAIFSRRHCARSE